MLFNIILLLHIAAAIVGFGGMFAHGAYTAKAFRLPAGEAKTVLNATQGATKLAEYAIYAVMPLGIVLIAVSDGDFSMGAPWVSASFVVWFVMLGLHHALVRPSVKIFAARAEALPADHTLSLDGEVEAASRKMMIGEAVGQLMIVVALILMVWKPGN